MKNKKLYFLCVLLSVFYTSFAEASTIRLNEDDEKNLKATFNPEVFSLSKKKENAFDAPSATYILYSEDIRRSGATSIPEALRLVPGLQVARIDGNKWAISARGFNNQYSNKLLVMIDGRIIYTPIFSGVAWDLHDYVLEDIDRIEVVRGPGGTIWGLNAVNGIINIITKSAIQTQGVYFSQIVGNEDKSITEARYGGETGAKNNYRVYAKKAVKDGLDRYDTKGDNDDGSRQDRAGFRYDISSIKSNTISIHGDVFDAKAENYFATLSNPNKNDKNSKGFNLVANWDSRISKKSSISLNAYFDYDQLHIPVLSRSSRVYDVDFQHFYNFSSEQQYIWGLGYRDITDDIAESTIANGTTPLDYTPNNSRFFVYSSFLQGKFGLIPDKLYLTVGSKFLINNYTGFEYQPNAKLAYYPSRKQTLWASISRAVRAPTRAEDSLNLSNGLQQGSVTVDSEELVAYEAGYRIKPYNHLSFDIAAFYNEYNALRTFEKTGVGKSVVANNGYGETYGAEFVAKWQVNTDWKLEATYEFLKMDLHVYGYSTDPQTGFGLELAEGQSPANQFKLKSFYNITPRLEFDNILYYVDNLPLATATSSSSGPVVGRGGIPSYFRFDTRLGYLPTRNLDLSVGIQNLLDQRHSEFRAGLYNRQTEVGRTAYLKLVWQY